MDWVEDEICSYSKKCTPVKIQQMYDEEAHTTTIQPSFLYFTPTTKIKVTSDGVKHGGLLHQKHVSPELSYFTPTTKIKVTSDGVKHGGLLDILPTLSNCRHRIDSTVHIPSP
jgi:hypothetical protein